MPPIEQWGIEFNKIYSDIFLKSTKNLLHYVRDLNNPYSKKYTLEELKLSFSYYQEEYSIHISKFQRYALKRRSTNVPELQNENFYFINVCFIAVMVKMSFFLEGINSEAYKEQCKKLTLVSEITEIERLCDLLN